MTRQMDHGATIYKSRIDENTTMIEVFGMEI